MVGDFHFNLFCEDPLGPGWWCCWATFGHPPSTTNFHALHLVDAVLPRGDQGGGPGVDATDQRGLRRIRNEKTCCEKDKKRWVAFVLGVWSQVFAHNFIKLFYSSHKPWLKWKCIESLKMLGKTWIFSGCGRMAEELGGDWGHCGSVHCCGQQGGTCELWLSGDARSSVLDDAPARGNANEIDVIHLCFNNSSEIGLWRFVVFGTWKHERLWKKGWKACQIWKGTKIVRQFTSAAGIRDARTMRLVEGRVAEPPMLTDLIQTWFTLDPLILFLFKPWGV